MNRKLSRMFAVLLNLLIKHKSKFLYVAFGAGFYQLISQMTATLKYTGKSPRIPTSPKTIDTDITYYYKYGDDLFNYSNRSRNSGRRRSSPPPKQPQKLKTILFWNSFFTQESYGLGGFGQGPFLRGRCKVDTCETTSDREVVSDADAVIFHVGYGVKENGSSELPKRSRPEQIHVFFEFEPPLLLRFSLQNLNDLFNLTFTYLDHPDTDIFAPYGIFQPGKKSGQPFRQLSSEALLKKTRQVAWMVSDCNPASKRMDYALALSKFINVDIYGKCGNDSCPRNSRNCTEKIENDYKFYLAFENSVCDDYITEKTFRMLHEHYLIPVVLGGANYSNHVPKNSVIDVRDFKSPEDLAKYLHFLDKNDESYLKYFEWKNYWQINTAPRVEGFCKLCEILHKTDFVYKNNFNIVQYWNPDKSCLKGVAEENLLHLKINKSSKV